MRRIRKPLFTVAAICLGLVVSLLLAEGLAIAVAYYQYGTIEVGELHDRETGNTFVSNVESSGNSWIETLEPHPYLGYVRNKKTEGNNPDYTTTPCNNQGFIGRDIPLERDESKFTILLTGGSVASIMCTAGEGEHCYLESILNQKYQMPKEVLVIPGGCGCWSQPQETIATLLYSDVADMVVSLEGFNERSYFDDVNYRIEYPGNNFTEVNPIYEHGHEKLAVAWQTNQLRKLTRSTNSRLAFFVGLLARRTLQSKLPVNQDEQALKDYYAFPTAWNAEKIKDFNLKQYRKYIKLSDAISRSVGADYICFLQPNPALGKTLTAEEKLVVGDLTYRDSMKRMSNHLIKLNEEGVRVISLFDVFKGVNESIYADAVHCRLESVQEWIPGVNYNPSLGYRLISEAMAEHIAAAVGAPLVSSAE